MQVRRIQNNNNYNPYFGAKFKIVGHLNNIPLKVLNEWENKVKEIGTENDSVLIDLDKERICAIIDNYNGSVFIPNLISNRKLLSNNKHRLLKTISAISQYLDHFTK